uniref:BLOC-1-related complex subunit 6 C-terminal helix domain-containing protein n=1 Tax=Ciona savignyi TaxID=51511 RepID=H2YQC9_CIOSA
MEVNNEEGSDIHQHSTIEQDEPLSENTQSSTETTQPLTEDDLFVNSLLRTGTVTLKGGQMSFVSKDFANHIYSASSHGSDLDSLTELSPTSSLTDGMFNKRSNMPIIDGSIINELETECDKLTHSVDAVIHQMSAKLNKITALSVGNIQTCSDVITEMGTAVDESVKSMYSLVAHAEELDDAMEPAYRIAAKINKIKDVLSALESHVH